MKSKTKELKGKLLKGKTNKLVVVVVGEAKGNWY